MVGRRKITFPGWMPGLYRKVGAKVTTYYTIDAGGKYRGLGNDLAKARGTLVSDATGTPAAPGTIAELLDDELARRQRLVAAKKLSPLTFASNSLEVAELKKPFGKMRVQDLRKKDVYDYLHKHRGVEAPVRANREISLLHTAYQPLVATEVIASNPCADVERNEEKPRTRKVTREQLDAFCAFARANGHINEAKNPNAKWAKENLDTGARMANAAMLSWLTTKAQGELLKLTRTRAKDEGIEWPGRKGGAPTITEWTPQLRAAYDQACAMPAVVRKQAVTSIYVIFTREGQPYTSRGFKATWGKIMKAYGDSGRERFTFHDVRAGAITKLREKGRNASEVSGHMQEKTVAKVYDRRTFRKAPAVE
jgi:integrase